MSNFKTLCEEWDQQLHTTWTYKKQKRIILEILKKCPTAKSFIKTISKKNLPQKIVDKIALCNINFNKQQYIEYLKNHIVKYSFVGKFILSTIIGYGAGLATFYGIEKTLNDNSAADYFSKRNDGYDPKSDYMGDLADKVLVYKNTNPISFKIGRTFPKTVNYLGNHPHLTSVGLGSITKFGTGALTYKLMDKLDKDRI